MLEAPNVFHDVFTKEFKYDFERDGPKLLNCVSSQGVVNGDLVYFDVVDPGDEAVEKGRDGRIPSSDLGLSQVSAQLQNHHKKYRIDDFDKFRANPNMAQAMQMRGKGAIVRKIEQLIVDQLDTATANMGAATILSTLAEISEWVEALSLNDVEIDSGQVTGVVSHRAWSQMLRIPEFKSADYTEVKVADRYYATKAKQFLGVNWIMYNGLTGRGTAAAKCYLFHRSAIGHMFDGLPSPIFFDNKEDAYSGVRFEVKHTAKMLLQRGVIQFVHNDTTGLTA